MKAYCTIISLAALQTILAPLGQNQVPQPAVETAALQKRIAELEAKIAPLQMELKKLRRQLHEQSPVTVIPVKYIDPAQAAEVVEMAFRDTPGVVVEALQKLRSVAVRADSPTTAQIRDLLRQLDDEKYWPRPGGFGGFGGFGNPPGAFGSKLRFMFLLDKWRKDNPPEKKSDRPGVWGGVH